MHYIEGFVASVPAANKAKYIKHATDAADVFKDYGALRLVECWEDDVPEGELTSFALAVRREPGESIVFSWITWPSRAVRDAGMERVMSDQRMSNESNPMPFDGKRMIFGGFQMIVDV